MAKHAALIINPASGGARKLDIGRCEGIATELGFALDILRTEHAGHATLLARQASGAGAHLIIAAGGDGTVNEVINGLALTGTPLGIVPLGTANVLALETGIPPEPEAALRLALATEPKSISLGNIRAGEHSQYFCLMAGAGFDARVVHNVNTSLKQYLGKTAYVLKALQTLMLWDSPELTLTIDGQAHTCQTAVVCNASRYAGNFIMAPEADISKPGFQVVMLMRPGQRAMLGFAMAFARGRHTGMDGVKVIKGDSIRIEGDTPIQLDGDDFSSTIKAPASISAASDALRLAF